MLIPVHWGLQFERKTVPDTRFPHRFPSTRSLVEQAEGNLNLDRGGHGGATFHRGTELPRLDSLDGRLIESVAQRLRCLLHICDVAVLVEGHLQRHATFNLQSKRFTGIGRLRLINWVRTVSNAQGIAVGSTAGGVWSTCGCELRNEGVETSGILHCLQHCF